MFTIISVITIIMVTYKTYVVHTNLSLDIQKENIRKKLDTNFLITNTTYDSTDEIITINVKNTGSVTLNQNYIDVFVDNKRIPRKIENRTLTLDSDTNLVNPHLWDPNEVLIINVSKLLSSGNHLIEVIGENGIKNADILKVS